jgi:hypothetical protein
MIDNLYSMPEIYLSLMFFWWETRNSYVRCPFCDKTRRHRRRESYDSRITRNAHYPPVPGLWRECKILFPFHEAGGKAAYEIRKEKKRFVTIGQEPGLEGVSILGEALESQLELEDTDKTPSLDGGIEEMSFFF